MACHQLISIGFAKADPAKLISMATAITSQKHFIFDILSSSGWFRILLFTPFKILPETV
jgi:hypothetical protein